LVTAVLPLTVFGISFERVRSLPRISNVEYSFSIGKVICFTWGLSGILSLPQFYAYEFSDHSNFNNDLKFECSKRFKGSKTTGDNSSSFACFVCQKVNVLLVYLTGLRKVLQYSCLLVTKTPLFGQVEIKVTYELLLCILLHFSPALYNIYGEQFRISIFVVVVIDNYNWCCYLQFKKIITVLIMT